MGGNVTNNTFTNSQAGNGLNIITRRAVQPDGQVGGGLRNLNLNRIQNNTFSSNALSGLNIDLRQNTKLKTQITDQHHQRQRTRGTEPSRPGHAGCV